MTYVPSVPNPAKLPPWPFTVSSQPAHKVPTNPFFEPSCSYSDHHKVKKSWKLGNGWAIVLYHDRIALEYQPDYDYEEDHNHSFAVDASGNPIIVESHNRDGKTTLPAASKFLKRVGNALVPLLYARSYEFKLFPNNPPSWCGEPTSSPGHDANYLMGLDGKRTMNYIGPYRANKWYGFSRSGYDHSHCHFSFGRLFRITWLEHRNYQHWCGMSEQEDLYWDAVYQLRKTSPIRGWLQKKWWNVQRWMFS